MLETVKTTKVIDGVEIIDRNTLSRFEKGELLNTTVTIAVFGPALNPYVFESAFRIATVILFSNMVLENLNERIRNVIQSSDGKIYVSSDSGNIYMLSTKN